MLVESRNIRKLIEHADGENHGSGVERLPAVQSHAETEFPLCATNVPDGLIDEIGAGIPGNLLARYLLQLRR